MQATSRPLTPVQRRTARHLAAGLSQRAAARRAGVNERTLYAWKQRDDFAALVQEYREAGADENPTDILHDLLNSSNELVRLRAAVELRSRAPIVVGPLDADADAALLDVEAWA